MVVLELEGQMGSPGINWVRAVSWALWLCLSESTFPAFPGVKSHEW